MKPAIYNVNTINLINSNTNDIGYFLSKQKEIKFKGYLIYNDSNEDNSKIVPFKNEYNYSMNAHVSIKTKMLNLTHIL